MHAYLWKETPQVSESVVVAIFDWKCHIFLNRKTDDWGWKILLFNYWNDLALGSVETNFLEGSVYMCITFLNIKTEEWDLNILLFIYWEDLALGSAEIYYLEDSAYVSLKEATTRVYEGRFCWI